MTIPQETQLKFGLIGNPKSDLNTSYLPNNGDVMRYFFHIFKIKMPQKMML